MFEWDDGNLSEIARHGLSSRDVEEALDDAQYVN